MRDRLRNHVNSGSVGNDSFSLDKFKDSPELSFASLSVELVKADVGGNIIKSFLAITRKLKLDKHAAILTSR